MTAPYLAPSEAGVTDVWWPYGPCVGRYTFKATESETGGELIQVLISDGRGAATPLHTHTDTDETFFVIEGTVEAVIGAERVEAGAGDFVFGPRGVPHAWSVTSERARLLVTIAGAGTRGPQGCGLHGFFNEVATPVVDGVDPPRPAMPDPELFAHRMAAYGIEMLGPPPFGDGA